jgi:hypothetical protein
LSLTAVPSNAGSAVTVTAGMKVFINGVDSRRHRHIDQWHHTDHQRCGDCA